MGIGGGVSDLMFPVAVVQVALFILTIKEAVESVVNFLLGRGWKPPSVRMLYEGLPRAWLEPDDDQFRSVSASFASCPESNEGVSESAKPAGPEKIKAELPVVKFGDFQSGGIIEEEVVCSVCLCRLADEDEVRQPPRCAHMFHKRCLDRWLGQLQITCPLCRCSLAAEDVSAPNNTFCLR